MALIGFKTQFYQRLMDGEKTQTIRPIRKHPIKVGEDLHIYVGLRTKFCVKIGTFKCTDVQAVAIWSDETVMLGRYKQWDGVVDIKEGNEVSDTFYREDGFLTKKDFIGFFKKQYGLPFMGLLIKWEKNGKH